MDRDVSRDVGEKTDRDDVVADSLDGAKRRADLGLLDLKTVLGIDGFGDVSVRDGTEETAVNAALGRNFDFAFVDRVGDLLGGSDTFGLPRLAAARLKKRESRSPTRGCGFHSFFR